MGFDVNMGSDASPSFFFSGGSLLVSSFAMLIDMDLSGAFFLFFFFFFSFPFNAGETKNAKRKNIMIFLSIMVLFDAFFYVFYEMAFLG